MLKKELKLRLYQEDVLNQAKSDNSLIVLPTGLGKTIIALSLVILELKKNKSIKILFLAPTRPLIQQHYELFESYLNLKICLSTGKTIPTERKKIYENSDIIFATPQTIENDILTKRLELKNVGLIIFDEAHNARKDYAYNFINKAYQKESDYKRVVGLSASPGSTNLKIREIMENLSISKIIFKTEKDDDVKLHSKVRKIIPISLKLPKELEIINSGFEKIKQKLITELNNKDLKISGQSKKELLMLQQKLVKTSWRNKQNYYLIKIVASLIKLLHAKELLELEGIHSLKNYLKKLEKDKSKSSYYLLKDFLFKKMVILSLKTTVEHPKINEIKKILLKTDLEKNTVIIFSKHRENSLRLKKIINELPKVKASEFLGQKTGYTQKKQLETLEKFKSGQINVLIATSVIHEGVHVENASVGIFFEPVPSAISSIQRKGRIGRSGFGKIYILFTKNCLDEKYYWAGLSNEKRLKNNIKHINQNTLT